MSGMERSIATYKQDKLDLHLLIIGAIKITTTVKHKKQIYKKLIYVLP